jgi:hypothetical protein
VALMYPPGSMAPYVQLFGQATRRSCAVYYKLEAIHALAMIIH